MPLTQSTKKEERAEMLAKLAVFVQELLKHPEYRAIVFVMHDGGVSGARGHFVRSRMFYPGDNSMPVEVTSEAVSTSPARVILCGIARRLEDHHNSHRWEDPRVTVCAFTSRLDAENFVESADPRKQAFWVCEPQN